MRFFALFATIVAGWVIVCSHISTFSHPIWWLCFSFRLSVHFSFWFVMLCYNLVSIWFNFGYIQCWRTCAVRFFPVEHRDHWARNILSWLSECTLASAAHISGLLWDASQIWHVRLYFVCRICIFKVNLVFAVSRFRSWVQPLPKLCSVCRRAASYQRRAKATHSNSTQPEPVELVVVRRCRTIVQNS